MVILMDAALFRTEEYRTDCAAQLRLLHDIEPEVAHLLQAHRARRQPWYSHDILPWGIGRDYRQEPWREADACLPRAVRMALEVSLLTEDNLPSYHAGLLRVLGAEGIWGEWVRHWTAEEGLHAIALRDYVLLSRNLDPRALEDARIQQVQVGFSSPIHDPISALVYTTIQELATRVAYRNTSKAAAAHDPIAQDLLDHIAQDENLHFIFYRRAVTLLLERAPNTVLGIIRHQLSHFQMPGWSMSGFRKKAAVIAAAGIYGEREHREQVLEPLIHQWRIAMLQGLSAAGERDQAHVLQLPALRKNQKKWAAPRAGAGGGHAVDGDQHSRRWQTGRNVVACEEE